MTYVPSTAFNNNNNAPNNIEDWFICFKFLALRVLDQMYALFTNSFAHTSMFMFFFPHTCMSYDNQINWR